MAESRGSRWIGIVFGLVFAGVLLARFAPFTVVPAGSVGVVTLFGNMQPKALPPGLHLVAPFSNVEKISTRIRKTDSNGDAASRDLQQVTTHITLQYHVDADAAPALYKRVGLNYDETIVAPQVQETFKAVTARYTAEELITKRDEVRAGIRDALKPRLEQLTDNGLVVDDFAITNFAFSRNFSAAIEAKQEAEQLALKAQRDLERVRLEAQQKIALAQAEAEALRAQKQEITPDLIKLREIEVQQKAIDKWDGKLPSVNGGALPFVNLGTTPR